MPKGKEVLQDLINLSLNIVTDRGEQLPIESPEDRRKVYLFAGLAYLIDLCESIKRDELLTSTNITLRSLFELVVKGINLMYDQKYLAIFELDGLRRQKTMNTYMSESPDRYSDLIRGLGGEDLLKKVAELYDEKKNELEDDNNKASDVESLTNDATKKLIALEGGGFDHFYNEIYRLCSNYFAHFNASLVSGFTKYGTNTVSIGKQLQKTDPALYKIAAGLAGIYVENLNRVYDLGVSDKLAEIDMSIATIADD